MKQRSDIGDEENSKECGTEEGVMLTFI
jgi:hypothetical protein